MTGKTEEKRKTAMLGGAQNSRLFIRLIGRKKDISIILLFCYFGYAIISSIIDIV